MKGCPHFSVQNVVFASLKLGQNLILVRRVFCIFKGFRLSTVLPCVYLCRNSDDNLLKNIELFDKLAVRFSSRVKFVRDIVGRGEICCWAFYGHAKKIAEVCCESIVYATDRKHTKIEFPEAKILDETLNIMLYEQRSYDPPVALRRERVPRPPGTPEGVLSEDELR